MNANRWIETIPFTETREYVSNVLAYIAIYEHRMNKKVTRLSHRMPPVPSRIPSSPSPTVVTQVETLPPNEPDTILVKAQDSNDPT